MVKIKQKSYTGVFFVILFTILFTLFCPFFNIPANFPVFALDAADNSTQKTVHPRIISLSPVITQILFALDAGSMVKGVTRWCDDPPQASKLPKVGDMNINFETLLALAPDLVLTMKGLRPNSIERLESLGINLRSFEISTINHICPAIQKIGTLVNRQARAGTLCTDLETKFAKIKKIVSKIKRKPRIYIEIWGNPVMTAGKKSFLNDLVDLAGGMNIFGHVDRNYFSVSNEEILNSMPERILICYPPEQGEPMAGRPGFTVLPAVRGKKIDYMPVNLYVRPGPSIGDALIDLFKRIHPGKESELLD
jgi:iron complex transport system substrate-binding protein